MLHPLKKRRGVVTLAVVALSTLLIVLLANLLLFRTPLYHRVLDPQSSAGLFEMTIARLRARPEEPHHDVLVLGDSRIYAGLDAPVADGAGRGLRFVNAAIPGTTPRCWPFLVRAIDPRATRYRAVVIPVDTYSDDDSAIGAIDGAQRRQDLHYIVYQVRLADIPRVAPDFGAYGIFAALDLVLRGPILRDDFQDLLTTPTQRIAMVAHATDDPLPRLRSGTLSGLRVDFARDRIFYPPTVPGDQRTLLREAILRTPQPSASYAAYRLKWLGLLLRHYGATHTPVIFVRIPARPLHRRIAPMTLGSIANLAQQGARIIPQDRYVALERPELFDDYDHLNAAGARRFSRLLAADVKHILNAPAPRFVARTVRAPAISVLPPPSQPQWQWPRLSALFAWGVPMYFQSYEFAVFFALVALLFFCVPRRAKPLVLLIASYYFYARWNSWYLVFLMALTASDYFIAIEMERRLGRARTVLLGAGVAANLAFLGVFKYANFAGAAFAAAFHTAQPWIFAWLVPIGISFHTFQSISYIVDVHRRSLRAIRDPIDYALYIAFFPQLLAGPIVRARIFFAELAAHRSPSTDAVLSGAGQILLGIVKKTVIADPFAHVADQYFGAIAAHPGAPAAWSGVFAFAMQIYFDFSGYSDIAIGCARLLGFEFPANFRLPYLATSITDFWHRWNISLSTWLRDYLYIPLGGDRVGRIATYRNLMITMLLGGLWHGANWTFVAWGAYHGILLGIERAFGVARSGARPQGAAWAIRAAITFLLVTLGWVLFRAADFSDAFAVLHELVAGGGGAWLLQPSQLLLVGISLILGILIERRVFSPLRWPRFAQAGAFATLIVALELLSHPGDVTPFVYFKF